MRGALVSVKQNDSHLTLFKVIFLAYSKLKPELSGPVDHCMLGCSENIENFK